MRARSEAFHPVLTSLAAIAWLAAVFIAPAREVRYRLPFELLPGVAYVALLAGPFLLRGGEGGGVERVPDLQFAAYGGPAYTVPSRLALEQPGGTDLTLDDIAWEGEPFEAPPYYGYRGIYWLPGSRFGVMGDFTHIKAKAIKERSVRQSGTRDGTSVPAQQPLNVTFDRLAFTHGYNLLTLNLVARGAFRQQRIVPYAGAGLGVSIPHVEVQRAGWSRKTRTDAYQLGGPAAQVLAGIEWRVTRRFSLFVEYKLSCSAIRGQLDGGGSVSTNLCTHQLLGGPAVHLRPR